MLGSFSPPEAFETPLWPVVALALGLIVGSFANVCIHRLPLGQSVVRPRSRCPHCGAAISAGDNVPLLSYALLRGRCRYCRAPISLRYPLVEAANGLLYLGLAWQLGPTLRAAVLMAFVTAMLVLSLIDLDHQILHDVITIPGIAIGLATSLLPGAPGLLKAAIGAVAGYCFLRFFTWAYYIARRVEGMGQGDWKMTAMIGAFLGWDQALLVVLLASVVGSAVGIALMALSGGDWKKTKIPLGTFLGTAGIVVTFVGSPIVAWYRGLLHG